MAKRHYSDGPYAGPLQKRALEHMDAEMVPSGMGSFANMPSEVVMKLYPAGHYSTYDLDDTMRGIDAQQSADSKSSERRDAKRDGIY